MNLSQQHSPSQPPVLGWICASCTFLVRNSTSLACPVCGTFREENIGGNKANEGTTEIMPPSVPSNDSPEVDEMLEKNSERIRGIERQTSLLFDDLNEQNKFPPLHEVTTDQAMGMSFAKWTDNDNRPWKCESCTFINDPLHLACKVCEQHRDTKQLSDESITSLSNDVTFNQSLRTMQEMYVEKKNNRIMQEQERAIGKERLSELIEVQQDLIGELQRRYADETPHTESERPEEGGLYDNLLGRNLSDTNHSPQVTFNIGIGHVVDDAPRKNEIQPLKTELEFDKGSDATKQILCLRKEFEEKQQHLNALRQKQQTHLLEQESIVRRGSAA